MISPFNQEFDLLLNGLLTDYGNQAYIDGTGAARTFDISQGTLTFIKSACLASALWGLHQAVAWTGDQIFPDTANSENLLRHAWLKGITPTVGESDADLLARLLGELRRPPAGGNKNDFIQWALSVNGVEAAWCYPLARGNGTVDMVVLVRAGFIGATVTADVRDYINAFRPVGPGMDALEVSEPIVTPQDILISNINGADAALIATEIRIFLSGFIPDQVLYRAQLAAIAINHGALNPIITTPPTDVAPAAYHMIRPGTMVSVNA